MSKKNNIVLITFDSCRFDSFASAKTPNISRIGKTEQRWSHASWTVPSHTVLLMGVSPHTSPRGVFASEVYKKDFVSWGDRLGIPDISFKGFVPQLSLPYFLRKHGYRTHGFVSMPVLNQATNINNYFDRYELAKSHNDFNAMLDELRFYPDEPSFYFFNVGETHYPYTLPGESGDHLPRIHGVHGIFKHLDDMLIHDAQTTDEVKGEQFFNMDQLAILQAKQRSNVEYLDSLFVKLFDMVPANTHIIVTSDHGECFGEEGYFGHGPIMHEKVFEVFFVEGKKP